MAEAAIGSLTIRQSELTADWTPPRSYDLYVTALSWEERSLTAIEAAQGHFENAYLLHFESKSEAVAAQKAAHLEEIKKAFTNVTEVALEPSTETRKNFAKLEAWLKDKYVALGRPLRVMVDITCLPKSYLLYLLGLGFTRDYLACFDCIYVGGIYDLASEQEHAEGEIGGPRSLVSQGEWRPHQIPYLTAKEYLPGSRDLIVALGAELGLSLPFIERVEPRRLDLIFIQETAPSDDRPMPSSERAALRDLLGEPNADRTDLSIGDVIGVSAKVVAFARSAGRSGVTSMALGTKTHALAVGIAALSERNLEVVCRTPASYRPINVKPSDKRYFFQIEDRFEPCSYIET